MLSACTASCRPRRQHTCGSIKPPLRPPAIDVSDPESQQQPTTERWLRARGQKSPPSFKEAPTHNLLQICLLPFLLV
eukprot:768795-Hanusia_phi.AAC.10